MVARRKGSQIIVPDFSQVEEVAEPGREGVELVEVANNPDEGSAVCAHCGELLAWHEEACAEPAVIVRPVRVPEEVSLPELEQGLAPVPFAYTLGQPVQPATTAQPHTIIWRGRVKERHPHTGLIRRVNVYRLNNGYWDCYYEAELRAA